MKKIISVVSLLVISLTASFQAFAYTVGQSESHQWMYENGLTKYDNLQDFRPNDLITRGEISKFITQYAKLMWFEKNYTQCDFTDISNYDYTLVPFIKEACSFGLIKGSGTNFMPEGTLTEAQAITIVVRSLIGFLDESGSRRWGPYYEAGKEMGIINNESIDWVNTTPITRAKVWGWFYIAANKVSTNDLLNTDGEEEILKVLKDIFGDIDL